MPRFSSRSACPSKVAAGFAYLIEVARKVNDPRKICGSEEPRTPTGSVIVNVASRIADIKG